MLLTTSQASFQYEVILFQGIEDFPQAEKYNYTTRLNVHPAADMAGLDTGDFHPREDRLIW